MSARSCRLLTSIIVSLVVAGAQPPFGFGRAVTAAPNYCSPFYLKRFEGAVSAFRTAPPAEARIAMNFVGVDDNRDAAKPKGDTAEVEKYRNAAAAGDAAAQFKLGALYEGGSLGLPQDDAKAAEWYRKAADQGYPAAQHNLAVLYSTGRGGLPRSDAKAVEWWRKAADQGFAVSQNDLAIMYEEGRGGLKQDAARAIELYRRAAEQGNGMAQLNLANVYADGGRGLRRDIVQALEWYRKAADQGIAPAQFAVGHIYDEGRTGIPSDAAKAVVWYKKAALQGHRDAQNNLAIKYLTGRGVAKDEVQAARWFKAAGEQGEMPALTDAATMYADGRGLPEDKAEALATLNDSLGLLRVALTTQGVARAERLRLCEQWLKAFHRVAGDRKVGFDAIRPVVEKAAPGSFAATVRGMFYVSYAWDARTRQVAGRVTDEQWRGFAERLESAKEAFELAWRLDDTNSQAAAGMITVELGQGKGRARMEEWFARAMKADPNNFQACALKAEYLQPKWHGSEKDLLAFGRECLAGKNWKARLPLILADAHLTLSYYRRDEKSGALVLGEVWGETDPKYWTRAEVWKDVQAAYEGCLAQLPRAMFDRSMYAKLACWCGQWEIADRQFTILGDNVRLDAFNSRAEYERLRAKASRDGADK